MSSHNERSVLILDCVSGLELPSVVDLRSAKDSAYLICVVAWAGWDRVLHITADF